jgi:hypothetical protein
MFKFLIVVGLLAAGYWYYTGPYQGSRLVSPEEEAKNNARLLDRCMRQEASINAGAGMAGAMDDAGDTETLCAEKLNIEMRDGQWLHRSQSETY